MLARCQCTTVPCWSMTGSVYPQNQNTFWTILRATCLSLSCLYTGRFQMLRFVKAVKNYEGWSSCTPPRSTHCYLVMDHQPCKADRATPHNYMAPAMHKLEVLWRPRGARCQRCVITRTDICFTLGQRCASQARSRSRCGKLGALPSKLLIPHIVRPREHR